MTHIVVDFLVREACSLRRARLEVTAHFAFANAVCCASTQTKRATLYLAGACYFFRAWVHSTDRSVSACVLPTMPL